MLSSKIVSTRSPNASNDHGREIAPRQAREPAAAHALERANREPAHALAASVDLSDLLELIALLQNLRNETHAIGDFESRRPRSR